MMRALLLATLLALPAYAAQHKTVLLVFDEDPALPGLAVINSSLRETFRTELRGNVEFLSESLNLSQFRSPDYDATLRDHLRRKYNNRQPDLIVAVMQPTLEFFLRDGQSLFPGVPIVFCGVNSSYLATNKPPPNVTGVVIKRDYGPTLRIALGLQPDTRNVYVVGGTSEFDRAVQKIAAENFAPYAKRVRIHYLTNLTMPTLLTTVRKLPERSAIIYLTLFADAAGRSFVPHEALQDIAAAANAPVFVSVDQYLNRGVVGGHVYTVSTHGKQAAELGVRVLNGEPAPVIEEASYADIFDWRQLQRWHFDESRLPPGSEVRYRTPSMWESYRTYIVGGIVVLLLQTALIVALLVTRAEARDAEARRQQAELEARRQRDELAHALRVTTLGELAASFAHELGQPLGAILMNAAAVHRLLKARNMTPEQLDEALGDIEEDANRAAETVQRLRALCRREQSTRTWVDMNEIVDDVVRLLRSDMLGKDIHVEFRRGERLPSVVGDPVQLRQVFLNLLVNAEDAITHEPGGEREIHIETKSCNDRAVAVVVRDTGIGATEPELERMFERFVTTKAKGLGMGLAISRSIVEAHRGRIWASRNVDRGISMHVEIPAS